MYIKYHGDGVDSKGKAVDGDGAMYQYVSSGVSAMATMVNPFSSWRNATENGGDAAERKENALMDENEVADREVVGGDIVEKAQSEFLSVDEAIQIDGEQHSASVVEDAVSGVVNGHPTEEVAAEIKLINIEDIAIESGPDSGTQNM